MDPRIERLLELKDDWDGRGSAAPNGTAAKNAKAVLDVAGVRVPDRILAGAFDGIALYWFGLARRCDIECHNTGELVGTFNGEVIEGSLEDLPKWISRIKVLME